MAETLSDPIPRPPARVGTSRGPWAAALLAGLIATIATWTAGEASVDRFAQKKLLNPMMETADLAGFQHVLVKNATLAHGLQGALLGLILGLAGAVASRASSRSMVVASTTGVLLGGLLGAGGSYGLFSGYYAWADTNAHDMFPSLLTHGGVAALIGAAGGLAFGIGLGGRERIVPGLIGGLVGAAIGAVLSEVLLAVVFPDERAGAPIASGWTPRLMAHALIDLLACLGAAAVVDLPGARSPRSPATPD